MSKRREGMEELKRGRGRPKKDGVTKTREIHLRVSDEFFNELNELCKMEGVTKTHYIMDCVTKMGALTRVTHEQNEAEDDENYVEEMYEDYDFDDEWE